MHGPGEVFGGYVIEGVLGHGGYATVYRARHGSASGGAVALKVLDEQHRHLAQLARLRREFDFAHRLDHPHVITVYERGAGWLSMEVVSGGNAAALPTVPDRLAALTQIADALDYIHNHGIVHCDVKTANILVHQDFRRDGAVLIDFGVACAVTDDIGYQADHIEASIPYSAPELLTGHAPSGATDEYALACTAVELLTGTTPFTADSRLGQIRAHLHSAPPRRSREIDWLPRVFDAILAKAMAKRPQDRYRSCREFISMVARALR
ncbi:serine/threonine-protein kinase [Mycobacterium deserti]|uniref:non-specific serine/threonine protein kinase n=1 Tax=Mycobacterium deserti TaxID=2978347 RepID=A0ABT2M501_9MYCO|nr:serine/threonine-protein kinase [Mycobacterium deserti]MCT7657334.1 serine/threonine protein kinase [Mycobacterium deserti]